MPLQKNLFLEGNFISGILGNEDPLVLPTWELLIKNSKNPPMEFYTDKAKFDLKYRAKKRDCHPKGRPIL